MLNQLPLQLTEMADNLRCPVKESHVPALIQKQRRHHVGHISISKILSRVQILKNEMTRQQGKGSKIIVVDAVTQEDLSTIAKAIVASNLSRLTCGLAGLAEELPEAFDLTVKK